MSIYFLYRISGKVDETPGRFLLFSWKTLNEVPNRNDAEYAVQYQINKGMSVDDVNCFD
jgi:hypothetical protein